MNFIVVDINQSELFINAKATLRILKNLMFFFSPYRFCILWFQDIPSILHIYENILRYPICLFETKHYLLHDDHIYGYKFRVKISG